MEEVKTLLVEVKEVLLEMSTVGALGVSVVEPPPLSAKDKKKQRKITDPERDEDDRIKALLRKVKSKRAAK